MKNRENTASDSSRRENPVKNLLLRHRSRAIRRLRSGIDWPFAILVMVLVCIGTTFVFSSSYAYAKHNYGDSYFFIRKQIGWVLCAIVIIYLVARFGDYLILKRFSVPIFLVSYLLLWCVFFFGEDANGAKRWIFVGPISVQPSEIVKFSVILLISSYLVWLETKGRDLIRTVRYGILPFVALVLLIGFPLYKQPHLSAMIIIFALIYILMYLGGVKSAILGSGIGIGGAAMVALMLFTSHGQKRIQAWLHPELDPTGDSWQPLQSLNAIGSGGLWGVGLGQSKQKHLYLPEPQNDYIFAIICEEMGFVFAVLIIALFVLLIWRGFLIARNAPSKFSSLLVMGIMVQVGVQVFLNIGVVTGALPATGVALPFFSYGGSSLLILMAEMGVVLNVSRYSYSEKT
ncbi:MAG: putative lipid II flippase FtsW [Clostridia bacterium]|nr:putative lipid II flippase FtsW [Clostridia bacterium]